MPILWPWGRIGAGGEGGVALDLLSGSESTSNVAWTTVGARSVDTTSLPTAVFRALIEATTGRTCNVRLYNLEDAVEVDGTSLNSSSVTPELVSASLVAGTTTGFPANVRRTYLLQIMMDSGAYPDVVGCKSATLEAT